MVAEGSPSPVLTSEVHDYIERSVLCWLATIDCHGRPNVSPKETFAGYGSARLLIANIASPGSVRNIQDNPAVCVSFVDVFVQKGFKARGRASLVLPSATTYGELVAPLERITEGQYPIHSIIDVQVEEIEAIRAPSYQIHEGTTEQAMVEEAMQTYGVRSREG